MTESITFSAPFKRSLLKLDTKILHPRISFRVNNTEIDNQYDIYSMTCANILSMIDNVDFTVSCAPVTCNLFQYCVEKKVT